MPTPDVVASPPDEAIAIGAGLLLVLAAIGVVVLARLWMRRIPRFEDDVPETRTIDRGIDRPGSGRFARLGRRRRRPAPIDAATAYEALIDDVADRPAVRREPAETPAEHARRLRSAGSSDLSLDLLAADYALARFAGVTPLDSREPAGGESVAVAAPEPGAPRPARLKATLRRAPERTAPR